MEQNRNNNNQLVATFRRKQQKEINSMKMTQTKSVRNAGFTLVEIMIVVAIIGLLAAIAIPNFIKARTTAQTNACINNLRQMDAAMNQYALELKLASSATYTLDNLTNYIKLNAVGSLPQCPASGAYTKGATVTAPPTCNIVGHVLP